MDVLEWLSKIGGILAVLGVVVIYLRGSSNKGIQESQARLIESRGEEIEDLTRRVTTLEGEKQSLQAENLAQKGQIGALQRSVAHVEELVQIKETLDQHHAESIAAWAQILVAVGRPS